MLARKVIERPISSIPSRGNPTVHFCSEYQKLRFSQWGGGGSYFYFKKWRGRRTPLFQTGGGGGGVILRKSISQKLQPTQLLNNDRPLTSVVMYF